MKKLTKGARRAIWDRANRNALACEEEARISLQEAIEALDDDDDVDGVIRHVAEALMHLGEARGHRNLGSDVSEGE